MYTSIKELMPMIEEHLIEKFNIPMGFIVIEENKNKSESIWLTEPVTKRNSKFVLNYSLKGSQNKKCPCFEVPNSFVRTEKLPEQIEVKTTKSNLVHTYLHFPDDDILVQKMLETIVTYYVERFKPSVKFGCCHRYKECSDAKKCLHPDQFYAKACYYKENLESGKIFY